MRSETPPLACPECSAEIDRLLDLAAPGLAQCRQCGFWIFVAALDAALRSLRGGVGGMPANDL